MTDTDVERLTGNPRRAILGMSLPLTVAMLISYVQNFIDMAWCSGLGSAAMAAVNVSGPLYWIVVDIGIGLGVGASTAVARAIGAKDKDRADGLGVQAVLLAIVSALAATLVLFLVCDPVLDFMTNGGDTALCKAYVVPYFIFATPIILHGMLIGMIRAEGSGRTVLYLSVLSCVINLSLDPVLIYTLGWGLTGAAVSTGISFVIPLAAGLLLYLRGRTFVRLSFSNLRFRRDYLWDLMYVGVPRMLELMAISFLMIPQNMLVVRTGGETGIVLALSPYKFIMLAVMPARGMSEAMIPVTSALQGAGRYADARDGFLYTVGMATAVCALLAGIIFLAAEPLTWLYSYSGDMADLHGELTRVLRIYSLCVIFGGLTMVFSGVLQALRMALLATITIFVRESVFIGMYIIASGIGMEAIFLCMDLGMLFGMILMGMFAAYGIRQLSKKCPSE